VDGDDIDNVVIRVTRLDKRMDGDEIISYITEKLRYKDDLNRLESSLGLTSESGPKVHFELPRVVPSSSPIVPQPPPYITSTLCAPNLL